MLPSRVCIPSASNPEQEDIFSSSLGSLFTDDTQNSHGVPGQSVVYTSPRYGDIKLDIPQHPDFEEGRQLFAHYLWNAGVVVADAIESASTDDDDNNQAQSEDAKVKWNKKYWDMRSKDILELGAGTALPSIIAALSSARSVTITDHPSSPAIVNGTIMHNVLHNLMVVLLPLPSTQTIALDSTATTPGPRTSTSLSQHGLIWGDTFFSSAWAYGTRSVYQPAMHSFDRMIIADCLWMPSQHENLVKTIDMWLKKDNEACALVVAGFHTGRSTVAEFLDVATGRRDGDNEGNEVRAQDNVAEQDEDKERNKVKGTLRAAEIFEVDVDCNLRPWQSERPGESKEQAKRWCVCAALVRR